MEKNEEQQNPFTRPGSIAAAAVIALIVVLGTTIGIVNATRNDEPEPTPTTNTSSATATTEPAVAGGTASICGLQGEELSEARLTSAPDATWDYQGTAAYP
ncbi:MAG: hypothetical protein ACK5LS_11160, partial [Propioniciclava sp.]